MYAKIDRLRHMSTESLIEELKRFADFHGIPHKSADEMLADCFENAPEDRTDAEKERIAWLSEMVDIWESRY